MSFKSPLRALPGYRAGREAAMGLMPSTYVDKVLGYGPIAYWVLNETAGGTAADQINSPAQDGSYTGVTLADTLGPDGVNSAPLFDGANDYVAIYSATLNGVFDGTEGTAMIWAKMFNVGVWTDGIGRYMISLRVDVNNRIFLQKSAVNNTWAFNYTAGGTAKVSNPGRGAPTDWVNLALTWSKTADEVRVFFDGSQSGATLTGLGNWAGGLASNVVNIGCFNAGGPTSVFSGWLAHCALWDSALAPAAILDLATMDLGSGDAKTLVLTASSSPYNVLLVGDSVTAPREGASYGFGVDFGHNTNFLFTPAANTAQLTYSFEYRSNHPPAWSVGNCKINRVSDGLQMGIIEADLRGTNNIWTTKSGTKNIALVAGTQYRWTFQGAGGNDYDVRDLDLEADTDQRVVD